MNLVDLLMLADLFVGLGEMLGEEGVEVGVVDLELFACVAPVMLAVGAGHLGVDVEPVLYGLGEIFHVVGGAVGAVEDASGLGILIELLEATVEVGLCNHEADAMDGVGKLMDEDVLGVVFVDLIGEDVLFGTGGQRLVDGATEATGAEVPVEGGVVDEVVVLGQVGGTFVATHDGHACVCFDHSLQHLRLQHASHGI